MNLPELRRIYARQMLALADALGNRPLEAALTAVPRESFLGKGPWRIMTPWSPYATVPEHEPALLYQDVVVALDEARGINNGSPSLHAHWLNVAAPRPGERVAHIGAGAGYYSAILAELVGDAGHVTAVEFDAGRARHAMENLESRANVDVIAGDGWRYPQRQADVIYVNFAAPRPADAWLDNLAIGGRLILPLGVPRESPTGGWRGLNALALLVTRLEHGFAARALGQIAIVFAAGDRGDQSDADVHALQAALDKGGWQDIKSLRWNAPADSARCWLQSDNWALSFDPPSG